MQQGNCCQGKDCECEVEGDDVQRRICLLRGWRLELGWPTCFAGRLLLDCLGLGV